MRSNEATPLSSQATASPSMMQERERRRANVSTISGGFASKRLRKRVLHHCTHLGTKTCGRIQLDRCCLVIRMQKVKKFAPNFDCYVERLDCPTAPQHPPLGRDCRRRASLPKVSYASERTTAVNLTPPESSGGGRGTTRRRAPVGP